MIPFLEAEHAGRSAKPPARTARVQFYRDAATDFREALVDLDTGKIVDEQPLPGRHSYVDDGDASRRASLPGCPGGQGGYQHAEAPRECNRLYRILDVWDGRDERYGGEDHHGENSFFPAWSIDLTGYLFLVLLLHASLRSRRLQSLRVSAGYLCRNVGGLDCQEDPVFAIGRE